MARFAGMGNLLRKVGQARSILWVLGLGGLLAFFSLSYWTWGFRGILYSPWVRVVMALLVGGGVFVGLRSGLPRLRERRFVKKDKSQYVAAGEESPEESRARFTKALQMLRELPRLKAHSEPLYALPWYLVLGDTSAGKTSAIKASELFSPLFPVQEGPTQNYEFWLSNSTLLLDTPGRYATHADADRDRQEWYRLLRLLHHHRAQEPINGLLVAVPTDWLSSQSDDELRGYASKLRDRIEEAVRELGVDLPVFLLVTKCDVLEGFAEFFGALPERVQREALGYVDDPAPNETAAARGAAALGRFEAGLHAIAERLHLFRLSILSSKAPLALRRAIFCFPDEFRALQRPLMTFLAPLLSEDVRYHTPRLRAVFFASASQAPARLSMLRRELNLQGQSLPAPSPGRRFFLIDLFDSMLPRDRGLISTTPREKRRKGVGRAVRVFGTAAILLLAATAVAGSFFVDGRIVRSVDQAACPPSGAKGSASAANVASKAPFSPTRLQAADACRKAVELITPQNRDRSSWSTWFANRSGRLEAELRERFLASFTTDVMAPLDEQLDKSFGEISDPLPLMLLVAQRIQLSRRCLSSTGCARPAVENFPLDYATMINPSGTRAPKPDEIEALRGAYASHLVWQEGPRAQLNRGLRADQERLNQWLTAKTFSLDSLLPLVNKRSPATAYKDYWEKNPPMAVVSPKIDSACTGKTWKEEIAPLLQQMQDAVPEADSRLQAFRQQYFETCFGQWRTFLTDFSNGAAGWRGPDQERLAVLLVSDKSPYRRVLADAAENLTSWLPPGKTSPELAWAAELKRYATSERRKSYELAMEEIGKRLQAKAMAEASVELTQQTFAEGKPAEESQSPILRAWVLTGPAENGAATKDILTSLLRDPVQYVWRFALASAAGGLQESWAASVVTPLAGLPTAEQVVMLYGPGGKLGAFVTKFIEPFLGKESDEPEAILGERLPLSPEFLQLLQNAKQLQPVFDGSQPPQPIEITAAHRSDLQGKGTLREERTVLQVVCASKTYRVTTRPIDASERSATVPWSFQTCADVTISVYFSSTGASAAQYQLDKRYRGEKGFLHFLYEFRDGAAELQLDEFEANPDQWNVLKFLVTSVTMYFSAQLPPGMEHLTAALAEATPPDLIASTSSQT